MAPHVLLLPLAHLHAHPMNSNVMPEPALAKLVEHIRQTDRYPAVIVRPHPTLAGQYQVLDGHHRVEALGRLSRTEAACQVWPVSDAEALTLLATLNRLQGRDDPLRRAALVTQLAATLPAAHEQALASLAKQLPEDVAGLVRLMKLATPPAPPQRAIPLEALPVAVHFFLRPAEKKLLDATLKKRGGTREQALMAMVTQATD